MNGYIELYQELGLPSPAVALAAGDLQLGNELPPSWMGFPPALLPLTSTESGIERGFWKHWFVTGRELTIVEFYGQTLFGKPLIAMELARNFTQFLYIQMLQEITLSGGLTPSSRQLAESAGITDLEWLHSLASEKGDELAELLVHPVFRDDPPQSCFDDLSSYSGDFPKASPDISLSLLARACGYEIHSRFGNGAPDPDRYRLRVANSPESPIWLKAESQPAVFYQLLGQDDLSGAWLSLNTPGWMIGEARQAISILSEKAHDPRFTLLANAWSSLPHEQKMGSYF